MTDEDKMDIARLVVKELMKADVSPKDGTQGLGNVLSQIHTAVTAPIELGSPDVIGGPEDGQPKSTAVGWRTMLKNTETRSRRQARDMAKLLGQQPPPAA